MKDDYSFNDWWLDAANQIGDDLDIDFDPVTRTQSAYYDGVNVVCEDRASDEGGTSYVARKWTFTHPRWKVVVNVLYAGVGVGHHAEACDATVTGNHYEAAPWFKWMDGADYVAAMRASGFSDEEWVAVKMGWPANEYHIE